METKSFADLAALRNYLKERNEIIQTGIENFERAAIKLEKERNELANEITKNYNSKRKRIDKINEALKPGNITKKKANILKRERKELIHDIDNADELNKENIDQLNDILGQLNDRHDSINELYRSPIINKYIGINKKLREQAEKLIHIELPEFELELTVKKGERALELEGRYLKEGLFKEERNQIAMIRTKIAEDVGYKNGESVRKTLEKLRKDIAKKKGTKRNNN